MIKAPMQPPLWWITEMDEQRAAMVRRSKAVGVLCGALFRIGQGVQNPDAAARRALEIIGADELVELAREQAEQANPKPLVQKVTMDHERVFLGPGAVTVGLTVHGFIGVWKDARSSPEPAGEGNTVEEAIYDAAVREGIVELGVSLSDLRKD